MLDLAVDYIKDLQRQFKVCYNNGFKPKPSSKTPSYAQIALLFHSSFMFFFPGTFRESFKMYMRQQAAALAEKTKVVRIGLYV